MGSIASFLANFTQGLTGSLQQHHLEQKQQEAEQAAQGLQTLQMAANHAAQLGDTQAYGNILKQIADYNATGSGRKGAAGKQNIIHHLADMVANGVPATEDSSMQVPLEQTALAGQAAPKPSLVQLPQSSYNGVQFTDGQPEMVPTRPRLVAPAMMQPQEAVQQLGQQQALATGEDAYTGSGVAPRNPSQRPALVRRPLFMTDEERQARDLALFEKKKGIESTYRQQEQAAKAKAAMEVTQAKIKAQLEGIGIRNTAQYMKPLNSLAAQVAAKSGRTEIEPIDIQVAGDMLAQQVQDRHERTKAYTAKLDEYIKEAPIRLNMMQQRINNALALGKERNAIAAGQLGLGKDKFAYQQQVGDQLKASLAHYRSLTTRLNEINKDIAIATEKGNDTAREEGIKEAEQIKTAMGLIEGTIDAGVGSFNQEQPKQQESSPAQPAQQAQPKVTSVKEGQRVQLKNGKTVTITKVYPDGSFDYQ